MSEALWLESYPWFLNDLLSLIWSVQPSPLTTSSTLYRHPASHYYCWYLCSTSNLWSSFFTWFLREIIGCSSDCFARLFYGDWLPWMIWCRREGCPDLLDYCSFVEHLWSKSLEFVINLCLSTLFLFFKCLTRDFLPSFYPSFWSRILWCWWPFYR